MGDDSHAKNVSTTLNRLEELGLLAEYHLDQREELRGVVCEDSREQ